MISHRWTPATAQGSHLNGGTFRGDSHHEVQLAVREDRVIRQDRYDITQRDLLHRNPCLRRQPWQRLRERSQVRRNTRWEQGTQNIGVLETLALECRWLRSNTTWFRWKLESNTPGKQQGQTRRLRLVCYPSIAEDSRNNQWPQEKAQGNRGDGHPGSKTWEL